jgi:hypothetical protein
MKSLQKFMTLYAPAPIVMFGSTMAVVVLEYQAAAPSAAH